MTTYVYLLTDRTNRTNGAFLTIQDAIDASGNYAEMGDRIEQVAIGHIDAFTTVATYQTWGWDVSDTPDLFGMMGLSEMPSFPTIRT